MEPSPGGAPVSSAERWWGRPCTRGVSLGLCRVLLTTAGGWRCRKSKVGPAKKLSKAIFGMLSTSRFYREVRPCLASQEQASSGAYVAGG
jgi:hypothetical protein